MGTIIELRVGCVTVAATKNGAGPDHGMLFQESDRTLIRSEQTDYDYCEEHGLEVATAERALRRTLASLVPRLEVLGFTLATAAQAYEQLADEWTALREDDEEPVSALSFDEFLAFLSRHPLPELDDTYIHEVYVDDVPQDSAPRMRARFIADPDTNRIPYTFWSSNSGYSEASYFASLIDGLPPHVLLRLLATVPDNLGCDVVWHYGPMVDSGWAEESEFLPGARREQKFLIATEGSSDVHVLRRAIEALVPEIADFFTFIDVSERHPFSSTGSLVKFAEGLAKIDVQNRMVFVFDNDVEGVLAYEKVQAMALPSNMRAIPLPDLDEFRSFPCQGPDGLSLSDINGRAAAIECYLDLRMDGKPPAQVRWTNYNSEKDTYHGALEYKESYVTKFMAWTRTTPRDANYDTQKLRVLLDRINAECISIAAICR